MKYNPSQTEGLFYFQSVDVVDIEGPLLYIRKINHRFLRQFTPNPIITSIYECREYNIPDAHVTVKTFRVLFFFFFYPLSFGKN